MEFRETLLAAQRNQQEKSSASSYYKARFDPPKKEQKQKDRLSANIQKFLAKKDEEERAKQLEAQLARERLSALRDPKALRKIQKTLKTIKSANKSVLEEAVDRDNTAVTLHGPDQPDQDDYGYESQEAAALYAKMMHKYSKIPDEPKFPTSRGGARKDLSSTRERVKNALQHEDDPVPHKRRRKTHHNEHSPSPPPAAEAPRKEEKAGKARRAAPPPMDFNQLLKLAEQKKSEPLDGAPKRQAPKVEGEPPRLMTKRQRQEYEEELQRRQRRQQRLHNDSTGGGGGGGGGSGGGGDRKPQKEDNKSLEREKERERKPEASSSLGRIPKVGDKHKPADRGRDREQGAARAPDRGRLDALQRERDRLSERQRQFERDIAERERLRLDRERLERLKAERQRIDQEVERLSRDTALKTQRGKTKRDTNTQTQTSQSDKVVRPESKDGGKKTIDLKSQNTYRIDKGGDKLRDRLTNGSAAAAATAAATGARSKGAPPHKDAGKQRPDERKRPVEPPARAAGPSRPAACTNSFDFDKHVSSLGRGGARPPGAHQHAPAHTHKRGGEGRARGPGRARGRLHSESEYDSEMDDFIDDADENLDYSRHIKEIFGYDKAKYRDLDDSDDPAMESSFVQVQREEYISKKHGIMEDLEDMRMEAIEKKKKAKKKRRISDD